MNSLYHAVPLYGVECICKIQLQHSLVSAHVVEEAAGSMHAYGLYTVVSSVHLPQKVVQEEHLDEKTILLDSTAFLIVHTYVRRY